MTLDTPMKAFDDINFNLVEPTWMKYFPPEPEEPQPPPLPEYFGY